VPLYEYRCEKCEEKFDKLLPHSERDETRPCPSCGSEHTKRLVSKSSFQLKGGGWASDGYSG
jgi:putative FmdB family regulatory protein